MSSGENVPTGDAPGNAGPSVSLTSPKASPFHPLTRLPSGGSHRSIESTGSDVAIDSPGRSSPGEISNSSNRGRSGSSSARHPPISGALSRATSYKGTPVHPRTRSAGHSGAQTPRHLSHGAYAASRPAPQPGAAQRDSFKAAVAHSSLASSSDGLQALLRDHPELVSHSLKAAAGPGLMERSESQHGSEPGTPGDSAHASMRNSWIMEKAPPPNLGTPGEF
jgi:hypothetical protein